MSKVAKIVLSVMLIMAVFCVCFGLGNKANFFETGVELLEPVTGLVSYCTRLVQNIVDEPLFSYEDEILVVRLYFDDGNYCDVARYHTAFANEVFVYSSNPKVVSYSNGVLIDRRVFYDNSGRIVYKQGLSQSPYTLVTTYEDYIFNYKVSSSFEGWDS